MGMTIGAMADMIVQMEAMMLDFGKKMCNMAGGSVASALTTEPGALDLSFRPIDVSRIHAVAGSVGNAASSLRQIQAALRMNRIQAGGGADPISDAAKAVGSPTTLNPFKWMQLMTSLMDTMMSMASNMGSNMDEVMTGITDMAGRIMNTIGLIGDMANQINTMAGRIVATMQLMENLANDCSPDARQ